MSGTNGQSKAARNYREAHETNKSSPFTIDRTCVGDNYCWSLDMHAKHLFSDAGQVIENDHRHFRELKLSRG